MTNENIVTAKQLRALSGLNQFGAISRWASEQGFRVLYGKDGPWATLQAINAALGVGPAEERKLRPEDII